jgi:hypothetical protein
MAAIPLTGAEFFIGPSRWIIRYTIIVVDEPKATGDMVATAGWNVANRRQDYERIAPLLGVRPVFTPGGEKLAKTRQDYTKRWLSRDECHAGKTGRF